MPQLLMLLNPRGHLGPDQGGQPLRDIHLRSRLQLKPRPAADGRGQEPRLGRAAVAHPGHPSDDPRRRAHRARGEVGLAHCKKDEIAQAIRCGDGAVEIEGGNDAVIGVGGSGRAFVHASMMVGPDPIRAQ
jgi:hypothetical protein